MIRLLVLFLLTHDVPVPAHVPQIAVDLVKQECIKLEILDERESWVFSNNLNLRFDLRSMRDRYQELQDAPPLWDSELFLCEETINQCLALNRQCREHFRNSFWEPQDACYVSECLEEFDRCYNIWSTLRAAKSTNSYIPWRRQYLKQLRDEMLGPQSYYNHCMPAHVPIELFRIIE